MITIIDLHPDNEPAIQQVAQLLIDGFAHSPGAWKDVESALARVIWARQYQLYRDE
jgi:hypothetical protein